MSTSSIDVIPVFLAAVDTGSLQGAARALDLARPTVRRRLAALEAEVGVPLLVRGPRGLRPTQAGQLFAERARQMMVEFDGLTRAVRTAGASPRGLLRVGIPAGIPRQIVAAMSDSVHGMWPHVRLELVCSTSNADLLERVDCRFALELEPPDDTMDVVDLGVVREQLVASRRYLDARPPIASVADLAQHPLLGWIAPDTGAPVRLPMLAGPPPRVDFGTATNDLSALIWFAAHDRGIVFMPFEPALARAPFVEDAELVPVLPDLVGRDRPRRLVTPRSLADIPVVAAFVAQTRAAAKALLGA
ncbi:MAG: LysR family transcriptional regulator [Myxococcales bacterium]|nr:LysR family transcriptional regulator [Myxococcales bacterium]